MTRTLFSRSRGYLARSVCREGWFYVGVLVFIAAGAMIRDINLLFMLAGMMLGPLVLSFVLIRLTLRRVSFSRKFAGVIGAGDLLVVNVVAKSGLRFGGSWALVVDDQICKRTKPLADDATARLFFSHVPPRGVSSASYRVRLHDRGRYTLGPFTATTRIPMGLLKGSQHFAVHDEVLVCPQLGRMLPGWRQRLHLAREGGLRSQQKHGQSEGDYHAMRDWRTGDSRRWIHWRTSAKRNQLAVKQFEQTANQDLAVFVDLGVTTANVRPDRSVERAVSLAATMIAEECRSGSSQLLFGSAGESTRYMRGTSSLVFHQEVMEHLAEAQPGSQSKLAELLVEALPHVPRDARVVIVTARDVSLQDLAQASVLRADLRFQRILGGAALINARNESPLHELFDPPATLTDRATHANVGSHMSAT